LSKNLSYLM